VGPTFQQSLLVTRFFAHSPADQFFRLLLKKLFCQHSIEIIYTERAAITRVKRQARISDWMAVIMLWVGMVMGLSGQVGYLDMMMKKMAAQQGQ
jgi:hypothetical protein